MSCLCIGGVCIPYSALLPCLLIGLQWIASQFAKVGLLPDFVAKLLRMQNVKKEDSCESKNGCCGSSKSNSKRSESVITTATSSTTSDEDDNTDNEVKVEHVETLQRWEEIYTTHKSSSNNNTSSMLFVKFTAEWCKPCKAIQPAYVSAALAHKNCTFITLDIDGDDCDILTGKLKVAMMPTFICFKDGIEVGRMSGGNSGEKLNCWVADMCSSEKKECTTNCCS